MAVCLVNSANRQKDFHERATCSFVAVVAKWTNESCPTQSGRLPHLSFSSFGVFMLFRSKTPPPRTDE